MVELTKHQKADIATSKTITDLTEKCYNVLRPVVSEHLPFDLVAYKDEKFFRIQCKYRIDGMVSNSSVWYNSQGCHKTIYKPNSFDYYAIYLPQIDKVVYPSIKFGGISINYQLPNSAAHFYWWEDFTSFTDEASKHNFKEFGYDLKFTKSQKRIDYAERQRKVERPSKEELSKLIWDKSMRELANQFGVSDVSIARWIKIYELSKPPIGYWSKKK